MRVMRGEVEGYGEGWVRVRLRLRLRFRLGYGLGSGLPLRSISPEAARHRTVSPRRTRGNTSQR